MKYTKNLMLRQWQEEKKGWIKDERTSSTKTETNPYPIHTPFLFKHKEIQRLPSFILGVVKPQETSLRLEKRQMGWMSSADLQMGESKGQGTETFEGS